MEDEQWRAVVGWEDVYEVSDLGRVRRVAPYPTWQGKSTRISHTGRPLGEPSMRVLTAMLKDGRPTVSLSRGAGTIRWYSVHTLVAEAFLGMRPTAAHTVNHINGDPTDNRASNLEWLTMRGQHAHALENGLRNAASFRSLSDEQALEIWEHPEISGREFARRFDVSPVTVSGIRRGLSYRWVTGAARAVEVRIWNQCSPECGCDCHYRAIPSRDGVRGPGALPKDMG
jgi:hypothetical protein